MKNRSFRFADDTPAIGAIAGKAEESLIRYNNSQGKRTPVQHLKNVECSSSAALKLTRLSSAKESIVRN
jgi:hypothetical protein